MDEQTPDREAGPHLPELDSWLGGEEAVTSSWHNFSPAPLAEYVNMREPSMDMKSVTDRAAQTLLWTELARGRSRGQGWMGPGWG